MGRFIVHGVCTISVHALVEADSKEAAEEKAGEADTMRLCHQCATGASDRYGRGDILDQWRTGGELDGEVQIEDVVEDDR